jgi:hypothetical protein
MSIFGSHNTFPEPFRQKIRESYVYLLYFTIQEVTAMSENSSPNSLALLSRKEKLEIWKMRTGRTALELAAILGIANSVFSQMIHGETMPVKHHQALIAAGVPEDCLPLPEDKKPGPKPRTLQLQGVSA